MCCLISIAAFVTSRNTIHPYKSQNAFSLILEIVTARLLFMFSRSCRSQVLSNRGLVTTGQPFTASSFPAFPMPPAPGSQASALHSPEKNIFPHSEGDPERLPFCAWLVSLTVLSNAITVATNSKISLFDLDDNYFVVYVPCFKIYSSGDREGLSDFVAIVSCAAVNTRLNEDVSLAYWFSSFPGAGLYVCFSNPSMLFSKMAELFSISISCVLCSFSLHPKDHWTPIYPCWWAFLLERDNITVLIFFPWWSMKLNILLCICWPVVCFCFIDFYL